MNKILLTAAIGMALASPFTASGDLLIDHFSLNPVGSSIAISASQGSPNSSAIVPGADAIGGWRFVTVQWIAGDATANSVAADNLPPNGSLELTAKSNNRGNYTIDYNGTGAGFGPINFLAAGPGIYVNFLDSDLGGVSLQSFVVDTAAQVSFAQINNIGVGTVFYPWGSYAGGADFTKVNELVFKLIGVDNIDLNIDFIKVSQPGVPDTAGTIALLSMALAFLGVARWKMKA